MNLDGRIVFTADEIIPYGNTYLVKSNGLYGLISNWDLSIIVPIEFRIYNHRYRDYYTDPEKLYFRSNEEKPYFPDTILRDLEVEEVKSYDVDIYSTDENMSFVLIETEVHSYTPDLCTFVELEDDGRYEEAQLHHRILEHSISMITINGQLINLDEYDSISEFNEGKAVIAKNGYYSYLDSSGQVHCDFKYKCAHCFSERVAIVVTDGGCGAINQQCEEIIPCCYAIIIVGEYQYSVNGCTFLYNRLCEDIIVRDENGDEGVYDHKGNLIIPIKPGQRIIIKKDGGYDLFSKDSDSNK